MVACNSRKIPDKWRSFMFPACPLPPEQQRYFHTLSRLYVIATVTYVLALLPMFWLLGNVHLLAITLIGLGSVLMARELHRRGYMTAGVSLVLAGMTWHMLESLDAYGAGVGFELLRHVGGHVAVPVGDDDFFFGLRTGIAARVSSRRRT